MTVIFDGKKFAREKTKELMGVMGDLGSVGKTPKMTAILVGDNQESELYLRLKEKKAKEIGIEFEFKKFSGENPQEIIDYIQEKNNDAGVNGIMVELPLPEQLVISNKSPPLAGSRQPAGQLGILDAIDPKKDIDCLTSENLRLLEEGRPRFIPPTVKAVGEIINFQFFPLSGGIPPKAVTILNFQKEIKETVVVGSNGIVGKGILSHLKNLRNLGNLSGVDRETKDLTSVTKEADILISATGVGHLIKNEMVKEGAIVIDVGIEKQSDGSLIGDVDFENAKGVASFITPVPGGVGPVTIVCLMENLLQSVYH